MMTMRWILVACAVSAGPMACNEAPPEESASGSSGATAGTSGDGPPAPDETAAPDGRPRVIDLGQDVLVLREGESVVLTAVVADDDDDVVMGELLGPGQPASYGSFAAHEGDRWRVTVSWDEVDMREPLSFSQQVELPFTARFVDAQGHEAEATITLRAVCSGLIDTACEGRCVDVQVDPEHCGGCGEVCRGSGCEGSQCLP